MIFKCGAHIEEEFEEARNDVPTPGQFHICYQLIKDNPSAATGKTYRKNCELARASGDLQNIPTWRCSVDTFFAMVPAIGEAVVASEHDLLLKKKVKFACLAEDCRKGKEQVGLRVVAEDYSTWGIPLDFFNNAGNKKAPRTQEQEKK